MCVMQEVVRSERVLVTGVGVVSPLGPNAESNVRSLIEAKDCVTRVDRFDVSQTRCKTAGQIPDAWLETAFSPGRTSQRLHRGARMAALALREACASAKAPSPELLRRARRQYRQGESGDPRQLPPAPHPKVI